MSSVLTPSPKQQYFDNNGNLLVGGKLYSFVAGTTTPLATYTSSAVTIANPNPTILDSRGEATIWLADVAYKLRLTDANDVEIWTVDNVNTTGAAPTDPLTLLAASDGSSLVGFLQAGTGAVAQTAQSKMRQYVNVDDFIDLTTFVDGVTDVTSQIQNAITFAQTVSGGHMEVRFSSRRYRVVGTLNVTGPVRLVGEGYLDFQNARPITIPPNGSWLIHANTVGPLIQFTGDMGKSSGMTNLAIFQEGHPTPGGGWSPASRDWVIRNESTYGTLILDRVHFHGVYRGVYTNNSARPHYENITGQFFYQGFQFDQIYDLGKLDGLHAWTYWSEADSVLQWQQANCIEITLLRVDGLWMDRIFTFAVKESIHISTSGSGGTSRVIDINGLYADFTGRAIVIDSTVAHVAVNQMFHLGQAWPPASPAVVLSGACAIDITAGSNHNVQVANLYSVLSEGSAIKVTGTNNQIWIASTVIEQYDRSGLGAGAFYPTSSNLIHLGAFASLGKYGGGTPSYIVGTPGGTVTSPTLQKTVAATVNIPVTAGSASGQLVPYTAEGEANVGVALIAAGTGIAQLGSAGNAISFYAGASATKGTLTGAKAGNVALANLITYLADRGLLTDGTS